MCATTLLSTQSLDGCCRHGIANSDPIKEWKFLEEQSDSTMTLTCEVSYVSRNATNTSVFQVITAGLLNSQVFWNVTGSMDEQRRTFRWEHYSPADTAAFLTRLASANKTMAVPGGGGRAV